MALHWIGLVDALYHCVLFVPIPLYSSRCRFRRIVRVVVPAVMIASVSSWNSMFCEAKKIDSYFTKQREKNEPTRRKIQRHTEKIVCHMHLNIHLRKIRTIILQLWQKLRNLSNLIDKHMVKINRFFAKKNYSRSKLTRDNRNERQHWIELSWRHIHASFLSPISNFDSRSITYRI